MFRYTPHSITIRLIINVFLSGMRSHVYMGTINHNPLVGGSNPSPATTAIADFQLASKTSQNSVGFE